MKFKKILNKKSASQKADSLNNESIPRITNESVEDHRNEILSGAKKYIYPLKQSRHKIVIISLSILTTVLIVFLSFTLFSLYKKQDTSQLMYQVTKIVPLPVARVGSAFVGYEEYLFELRHYIHYFENQQKVDFTTQSGKDQLVDQRKNSMRIVLNNAYVKQIAKDKNISVTNEEVDKQIELLKAQNRLGANNQVFEDVLEDYWGWDVNDFKRSVKAELLKNKVIQALDPSVRQRADIALAEIKSGKDFGVAAQEYSDDETTKDKGGNLDFLVSKSDKNIPPQTAEALFNLKTGEVSEIIDLGYGLEIVKNVGTEGDKIKAARIFFAYKDTDSYLNDYKEKQKSRVYIKVEQ